MQSFINTPFEAEIEDHLGYHKHKKANKPNKRNMQVKRPYAVKQLRLRYLP